MSMVEDSEVTVADCPVEGCQYRGLRNSVAAHYCGSKPESGHDGGYEKAQILIDRQES